MKKIIIGLVIVIGVIAILPMIGNSVAEEVLKSKVDIISKNGVEIKNENSESSYLNTKKHYEFLLSDVAKFVSYINKDNTIQMPLYLNETMNGLLVGMDIEYSNIPIDSKLKIDIYPLKMPTEMDEIIKEGDKDFYSYLDKLIQSKTFLYHMNYDLSDASFDGYLKNIDEKYELASGAKLYLNILDAKDSGQGLLNSLNNLHVDVAKFALDIQDKSFNVTFKMDKFNSDSVFESENSTTNTTVKSIFYTDYTPGYYSREINLDSIKLNTLLKIVNEKIMFSSKSSVGEFKLNSKIDPKYRRMDIDFLLIASGFNYDITLDEVDKVSFEKFSKLLYAQSQTGSSYARQREIGKSFENLLSKGFKFNIADLSLAKLSIYNEEPIDGFSAVANLVVKEGPIGLKSFKATSTVKLSKDLYTDVDFLLGIRAPMEQGKSTSLAKEDGDNLLFEIKLDDGDLTVNGEKL